MNPKGQTRSQLCTHSCHRALAQDAFLLPPGAVIRWMLDSDF